MWKRWKRTSPPNFWDRDITTGKPEQSIRNWMCSGWLLSVSCWRTSFMDTWRLAEYLDVKCISCNLVFSNWGQSLRMWGRSSGTSLPLQLLRRQMPVLFWDQWLQNISVRYLPESIFAWIVALITSYEEEPAVNHRGCGFMRDIKFGLKYWREGRQPASAQSLTSQNETTAFVTMDLNTIFFGGSCRRRSGCGSWYCRQIFLIWWNHDLLEVFDLTKTWMACLWRRLPCSLVIMPNRLSNLRWRSANPGREPARKWTTQAGVPV